MSCAGRPPGNREWGKVPKMGGGVGSVGIWGEDDHQNGSTMIKELKFEM